MKKFLCTFLLLLCPVFAYGADVVVPAQVIVGAENPIPLGELVSLSVSPISSKIDHLQASTYTWKIFEAGFQEKRAVNYNGGVFFGAGIKKASLLAVCTATHLYVVRDDKDKITEVVTKTVVLTAKVNIGGKEPGPDPGPDPDPEPEPGPTPIPTKGFRALIVYESSDLSSYPAKQVDILFNKTLREYLNQKCVKGEDGKTPEYRIFDKDISPKNESKIWQDAMARARSGLPWLLVSNGESGWEGPLPGTLEETMAILKKYAE